MKKLIPAYRFFLFIPFLAVCITSCSNDADEDNITPEEGYYVRFKVDGVPKEFKSLADVMLNEKTSEGHYHFAMVGLENYQNGAATNNLTLSILDPEPVVSDVEYTNYDPVSEDSERVEILNLIYLDETGVSYTSLGDEFSILGVVSDTRTTILEITETSVKGTFSGTLYNIDLTGTVVISEGEFWAEFY